MLSLTLNEPTETREFVEKSMLYRTVLECA